MKKFGRLDSSGKVLEVVQSEDLSKQFHKDTANLFVELPEAVGLGYVKNGESWVDPAPSSEHVLKNGVWELPLEIVERRNKDVARRAAKERLKGINDADSIPALRALMNDILILLNLDE